MATPWRLAATLALGVAGLLMVTAAVLGVSNVSVVFDGEVLRCGAPVNLFGAPHLKPVNVSVFGPAPPNMTYDSVTGCGDAKREREKAAAGCAALAVAISTVVFLVAHRRRPRMSPSPT